MKSDMIIEYKIWKFFKKIINKKVNKTKMQKKKNFKISGKLKIFILKTLKYVI